MFPFFPPNQPQLPFDSANQQLRPGGAPSWIIHLQPPVRAAGFNPQYPTLMMPWPYPTTGINPNVADVPLTMQFGLHQQQQQLQNFNAVVPTQLQQQQANPPQHGGQLANHVQGMMAPPVNALVLQHCLQSILGANNQMAAFANPVVGQPAVANAVDGAEFRSVDQRQQGGGPSANCWNARPETPAAPVVPDLQQVIRTQNNLLASGAFQTPQEGKNEMRGNNMSHVNLGKSTSTNFKMNPNGSWKGIRSQGRFQKPQACNMINGKGNFRQFTGNRDKGTSNRRQRHPQHAKFDRDPQTAPTRSLSVTYTDQEILQWREARKRNYPTKSKIEKKLNGVADMEAESRRQQLKDVLAKQAELGVEVAELPPNYLSESENKAYERDGPRKVREERRRFQNRFNKRGRRGQDNRYSKRQRPAKPANNLASVKRSPTLLQKLLSAEIKRDKVYLLQVFRFMTLNSFFDSWPEKPLVFPQVTARDTGNGTAGDLPSVGKDGVSDEVLIDSVVDGMGGDDKSNKGEVGSDSSLVSTSESDGEEEDGDHENSEKSEEGEITE